MPIITISRRYLNRLLGRDLGDKELEELAVKLGAEIEEFAGNEVLIEMPPNRADMYSIEGFARSVKGFLRMEMGLPSYHMSDSGVIFTVDKSVENIRPYVVGGVVRNLKLDEDSILSLMDFQEKIHLTIGRNRRKVSVGIHDFDKVTPPFVYKAENPKERRFVPLAKEKEMDMDEILKKHEKGIDYAYILEGFDRYPLIVDKNDNVLSFPPIINSALTTVTEKTKNIFIDVTGTDLNLVNDVLILMATGMAETGASLGSVAMRYPDKEMTTPDLAPRKKTLNVTYANRILGLELQPNRIKDSFEKMRYGAELRGNDVLIDVPAYRSDILHPIDLVEDLAIGYGYDKFKYALPKVMTFGGKQGLTEFCAKLRDLMLGLGFQEVDTLALGKAADDGVTRLLNPLSEEQNALRISLIHSLLEVLRTNKRHDLPQMIFQIGDVVKGSKAHKHLACMIIHSKTSFTDIKSYAETITRPFGLKFLPDKHKYFITGRCAFIMDGENALGMFGEVHPKIITEYELGYPTTAFELDISKLKQKLQ